MKFLKRQNSTTSGDAYPTLRIQADSSGFKYLYYLQSGWILLKVNDPHRFNRIFLPYISPSKVRFWLQSAHVTQDFTLLVHVEITATKFRIRPEAT